MDTKGRIKDIYPLTPMQEGMLFHSLRDPSSYAYFEQMSYRLKGKLEVDIVKKSLVELLERYDILRTVFAIEGADRPLQVVLKEREAVFYYEDAEKTAAENGSDAETRLREFKKEDRGNLFDLTKDGLMRVAILKVAEGDYEFIWSYHHIIMDGWCIGILTADFWEFYNSFRQNREPRLRAVTPYSTYIAWLQKQDKEKAKDYWQHSLEGYDEAPVIPNPDASGLRGDRYDPGTVICRMSREDTAALNKLAGRNNVTMNRLVQTIWGILLGRYNRRRDILFGAVVSGRPAQIPGVETMVGLFINTIPVRIQWQSDTSFHQVLKAVHREAVVGEPHHYYPLVEIQSFSSLKQNLIDHILVFENFPVEKEIDRAVDKKESGDAPGLQVSGFGIYEHTHYDFNIMVVPEGEMTLRFQYNGNVYAKKSIERIARHFVLLLEQVLADENIPVGQLDIVSTEEKQQLLEEFNGLKEEFPGDEATTIHSLFQEQVKKTPDSRALQFKKEQLNYNSLNSKANQLARVLRKKGVTRDSVVGLMVERSTELVLGLLAIFKAGGAYLPIDAEYPEERRKYMLEDSGVSLLLVNRDMSGNEFIPSSVEVLDIGDGSLYSSEAGDNLEYINQGSDLIYVIYTSGSTGKPKGIMLEHRNLVNLMRHHITHTNIDNSRILQFCTISFDPSFQEIFAALLTGGCIYVIDKDTRTDIPALFKLIKENEIKTVFLPMSFLKLIFSEEEYIALIPPCIRHIQTAGEQVVVSRRFREYLKENRIFLHNHYGPAEAHVVTTLQVDPAGEIPELPTIGAPVLNTRIYIVDQQDQLLPVGVPGELLIGGIQVGRGYLGREELTAERFIADPFAPGDRIYRTGDLASWRPDGNVEFLGRIDNQVKIRGFRVEPGEVEKLLLNHGDIKKTVVTSGEHENKDKYLCAYYTSEKTLNPGDLRDYLSVELPEYMIPGYFLQLLEMPLMPNGKVDYKSLPHPKGSDTGTPYEPPTNEIEKKIIETWVEVLELDAERIGINHDFFELGGNSINILKVVSRLKKAFKQDISMSNLFLYTKVRDLALNILQEETLGKLECIVKMNKGGNKKNIFIFHPLHGMIYQYKELAKLLENDFNVFGIQARGMTRRTKFPPTFDHLVADYFDQVREVQPEGPYILMSYCYGSMIAFETVKRMEDMGIPVQTLIMLDEASWLPDFVLRYYRVKGRLSHLTRKIKKLRHPFRGKDYINPAVKRFENLIKEYEEYRGDSGKAEVLPEEAVQLKTKAKINLKRMMNKYFRVHPLNMVAGFIDSDLVDIRAEERRDYNLAERFMKRYTFGKFKMLVSPGNHDTMLASPNVETLARLIKENVEM